MYKISVEDTFSAAHFLRHYEGKCERLHGHNWKVRIKISGKKLKMPQGMLIDFSVAKKILSQALSPLDHQNLNEVTPFNKINPSAENIARYIFKKIATALKKITPTAHLESVSVWESDKNEAEYQEG